MQTIVSIDLETRGQNPATCAIANIGVVIITPNRNQNPKWFEAQWGIARESALEYGEECPDTMAWWADQSEEAQRQLQGTITIKHALTALSDVIESCVDDLKSMIVVARAPSFDCAILSRHYAAVFGTNAPWKYYQERDHRTYEEAYRSVCAAAGINYPSYKQAYPVAHDALSDARNQALYLLHIQQMAIMAIMATRK